MSKQARTEKAQGQPVTPNSAEKGPVGDSIAELHGCFVAERDKMVFLHISLDFCEAAIEED